jgi:hypothetical protein
MAMFGVVENQWQWQWQYISIPDAANPAIYLYSLWELTV